MTLYARWRDVAADATHRLWRGLQWAGAVGPQDRVARRYHHFGDGTLLAFPPGDVFGEEHISLGDATLLAAHVSLSVGMAPGQPLPPGRHAAPCCASARAARSVGPATSSPTARWSSATTS